MNFSPIRWLFSESLSNTNKSGRPWAPHSFFVGAELSFHPLQDVLASSDARRTKNSCGIAPLWTLPELCEGRSKEVCICSALEEADGVRVMDGGWEGMPEPGSSWGRAGCRGGVGRPGRRGLDHAGIWKWGGGSWKLCGTKQAVSHGSRAPDSMLLWLISYQSVSSAAGWQG